MSPVPNVYPWLAMSLSRSNGDPLIPSSIGCDLAALIFSFDVFTVVFIAAWEAFNFAFAASICAAAPSISAATSSLLISLRRSFRVVIDSSFLSANMPSFFGLSSSSLGSSSPSPPSPPNFASIPLLYASIVTALPDTDNWSTAR